MRALVFLMALIVCATSLPSVVSAKMICTTDQVSAAFLKGMKSATPIKLGNAAIAFPYAIQPWSTKYVNGQVLLKFDASIGKWVMRQGPPIWDVPSLMKVGISEGAAKAMIYMLQTNYAPGCSR